MAWASYPKWKITKTWDGYSFPNIHWWILNKTVFTFFLWLERYAWKYFCTWKNGWLYHKPLIAKIIHRIGKTTAGCALHGGECWHCGAEEGNPVDLSDDETGEFFKLEKTWTACCSEIGTDYRFCGVTICPKCGFEQYYEDGSL